MSEPPYRALRIVLGFLSLLLALGGLLLIFSRKNSYWGIWLDWQVQHGSGHEFCLI